MSGTKAGGKKAAATNLKRNPEFYKEIGAIGGRNSPGSFQSDRALASRAGKVGGTKSRKLPPWKQKVK